MMNRSFCATLSIEPMKGWSSQWHAAWMKLGGIKQSRMVIYTNLPERTQVEELSAVCWQMFGVCRIADWPSGLGDFCEDAGQKKPRQTVKRELPKFLVPCKGARVSPGVQ